MTIKYPELDDVLTRAGASGGAAEAHGVFCGLLCSAPQSARRLYFDEVFEVTSTDNPASGQCRERLDRMMQETASHLAAGQMEFELMLPDDRQPLEVRTRELARWCQAFLTGLARGDRSDLDALPDDARELVDDFAEITRAGIDAEQDAEEAENAYAELVEYVRVGVQVIFEELNALEPLHEDTRVQLH